MRRPRVWGARPRRVVSTSGSSGKCAPSAPLLDLRLFVGDVLTCHGVEFAHFQLVRVQALVLGGHVEVTETGRGQQLDLLAHGGSLRVRLQILRPLARSSSTTFSMPFFSTVRMPLALRRRETQRFSVSTQNRCVCRFGRKRRRFLLLA